MERLNFFERYFPPTPENLSKLEADIAHSTDLRLPTSLQLIVDELMLIADWCNSQSPARRTECTVYESIIMNTNARIADIRAELAPTNGYFYPTTE